MLRRYELTDEEWLRIEPLLPPENTGKQGRPRKDNRIEYSCAVTPQVRQTGNRLSGLAGTAYASLFT